jgi:hypothetical protein
LPAKVTFLTDGDSCNCNEDFVLVASFAKPFENDALFPLSKSRTIKYLESSWHLLTNLISAVISLPELNIQENKPSELAVVPTEIIITISIKRIITPFISNKINNKANHSIILMQNYRQWFKRPISLVRDSQFYFSKRPHMTSS